VTPGVPAVVFTVIVSLDAIVAGAVVIPFVIVRGVLVFLFVSETVTMKVCLPGCTHKLLWPERQDKTVMATVGLIGFAVDVQNRIFGIMRPGRGQDLVWATYQWSECIRWACRSVWWVVPVHYDVQADHATARERCNPYLLSYLGREAPEKVEVSRVILANSVIVVDDVNTIPCV